MLFYPINNKGYHLLHSGTMALMDIEEYGVKIDKKQIEYKRKKISKEIKDVKKELLNSKEGKLWKKLYPQTMKLKSGTQLKKLLYKNLGYTTEVITETGEYSSSEEALQHIKSDFIDKYLHYIRLEKLSNTFLKGIEDETIDGVLHPFFNLNTVTTYRSSSSAINFQNLPTRHALMKEYIRQVIVPRKGFLFTEIDYSGMEVRGAACYHQDPEMIAEICDPGRDMHRDMAKECFLLNDNEWTKLTRFASKNNFVFAQFYGDYYESCAKNLWNSIDNLGLETSEGKPIKTHLKEKGIHNFSDYVDHIKEVENCFWNSRFKVYNEWRKRWYKDYINKGYFETLTGFRCGGRMKRNNVINYPVQGSSFHCLLWSLIKLHSYFKEHNLQSKIIGQIHDSIVLEIHPKEALRVLTVAKGIMTIDIRKEWDWLIVPLEIEVEMAPLNKSWYYKEEIHEGNKQCSCGFRYRYENKICPVCGKKGRKNA